MTPQRSFIAMAASVTLQLMAILAFAASCGQSPRVNRPLGVLNEFAPAASPAATSAVPESPGPISSTSPAPDAGLPKETALGVAFEDSDPEAGNLQGEIKIQKAADESSFANYAIYWGSSASAKLDGALVIAVVPKTGANLSVALAPATVAPENATHILVFTRNERGEMAKGVSTELIDVGLPAESAVSLGFTDTNPQAGKLSGELQITKAFDESTLEDYLVYWGSSATTKLAGSSPLAIIAKTGNNLNLSLQADTPVPSGATHLLVRTKNHSGEMATGVSTEIDDLGVPTETAAGLTFVDTNGAAGKLGGNITIIAPDDTTSFTHYVIHWGSDATTKLEGSAPIATIAKGNTLTFAFPPDSAVPAGATHLLVRTKNDGGEMFEGPGIAIDDLGLPRNPAVSLSFTDTEPRGGRIMGSIKIARAIDESDLSEYAVYWGQSATAKIPSSPLLGVVPKTGQNPALDIPSPITKPAAATHFLVRSRTADGEMATGPSIRIDDQGVPTAPAISVTFADTDPRVKQIKGKVEITRAANEADLTEYVVYWGANETTKLLNVPAIARLSKSLGTLEHNITLGTSIPAGASHLLVRTKNTAGEMTLGVSVAIEDLGVPTNAAVSLAFADTDQTGGEIAGKLFITKSTNESDLTAYVIYWGANETEKLAGSVPIKILPKTGQNLSHTFAANTKRPQGATHILVRTKNADGEMTVGPFLLVDDIGVPTAAAAAVSFSDTNQNGGKLDGIVNIVRPSDETSIQEYRLYWGSGPRTKLSGTFAFARLAKSVSTLSHTFALGSFLPAGATHILVRAANAGGEMATGPSILIEDKGVPSIAAAQVAYTDTQMAGGRLGGNVNITKALDEADITHYAIYWGSNGSTKLAGNNSPIAVLAKTGSNLTFTFAAGTVLPAGATHLLVRTRNADGEMARGVGVLIVDQGVPIHAAAGVQFNDTEATAGQIAGPVSIAKASSETDLTHYVLYWGVNASTKLAGQPKIAEIVKDAPNLSFSFAAQTAIPAGATHLLVRTKNADGEMATGPSVAITDL